MTTPTMSRRFGVEIEFLSTITKEQAVMSLKAAGIQVESSYHTHDTTPHWKIVADGSCGLELVSPVLEGEAGIEEVRFAAAALEAAGDAAESTAAVRNRPEDNGVGIPNHEATLPAGTNSRHSRSDGTRPRPGIPHAPPPLRRLGDLEEGDKQTNEEALTNGDRILSHYKLGGGRRIYIITEADRSSTCILLPEEY